jgi:hypothetical protein
MPTMPTVRSRKRRRELVVAVLAPVAGAQIALGLRQMPHGGEQEPEGGVGDFLVEHIRRVGDDDAVSARPFGVDVVVADAEARDDLELGKARHQRAVHRAVARDCGDRPHLGCYRGDEGVLIRRCPGFVQREARFRERLLDNRLRAEHHHVGFVAGHERSPQ